MDTDWGLPRQLPPPDDQTKEEELVVKQRNALCLKLDAETLLTCTGELIDVENLSKRVEEFVANSADDSAMPEKSEREVHLLGRCKVSDRHVIIVEVSPKATYDAYFQMQNAVVAGYNHLRDELAQNQFHRSYAKCNTEQRDAIALVYPQRISEQALDEQGGEK